MSAHFYHYCSDPECELCNPPETVVAVNFLIEQIKIEQEIREIERLEKMYLLETPYIKDAS